MKTMFINPGKADTEIQIKDEGRKTIYVGTLNERPFDAAHTCAFMALRYIARKNVGKIEIDITGLGEKFKEAFVEKLRGEARSKEEAEKAINMTTGYCYQSFGFFDEMFKIFK